MYFYFLKILVFLGNIQPIFLKIKAIGFNTNFYRDDTYINFIYFLLI
jgi:hypothetical protein